MIYYILKASKSNFTYICMLRWCMLAATPLRIIIKVEIYIAKFFLEQTEQATVEY